MASLEPGDPSEIGGYRLLGRLGAGGMGQVFLGRSQAGLTVAIKVVHEQFAHDPGFRARFRREVTAARAVSGAFTAAVIDADPDAPSPWLVTAYLPGLPLNEAVERYGPFPPLAVAALGAGLAEALISIHQAGVVHRDLKPHNVMLSPDGPRVIDFGIAHATDVSAITRAGAVVGSPGYMSPEQAQGRETGPAGDVFSLGAVLAFAATGSGPFGRSRMEVMIYRVVHEAPRLDGVSDPRLRELIAACLDKDPVRRPTPDQVLRWLATGAPQGTAWLPPPVSAGIFQSTRRVPVHRRPLSRRGLLLGAGGAIALVAGGAVAAVAASTSGVSGGTGGSGGNNGEASARALRAITQGTLVRKLAVGAPVASGPVLGHGLVIVGTNTGQLVAFDAVSGAERWRYPAAALNSPFSAKPVIAGAMLFAVGGDGSLHAVELATGQSRWNHAADASTGSPPAIGDRRLYVLTGNSANQQKTVVAYDFGGTRMREITNVNGPPAIGTDDSGQSRLYLSGSGSIRLYTPGTLQQKGQIPAQDGSPFVVQRGVLYGMSESGRLWAYATATRSRRWERRLPGASGSAERATAAPALSGGSLYLSDANGILYAIDARTGTERWRFTTGGQIQATPFVGDGMAYVGSADKHLYAVGATDGEPRWRFPTGGPIGPSAPVVSSGVVFVGSQDGALYAIRGR
ncbi:outer membrane protein assembly factor BamB family protein [Actinomadura rudentiformis]|uniref:PQQ-binding-like beta-propeller repeat protein n=1 Tax=Actinomadura rudentiformis TaxID=359158 RepID=A0A6H9YSV1_9ACTN|nr:serine/threonine-protein kinase [Actinomadura rudentiformis]KAB2344139.1 PQQ-binding-like beta-propeller repeat protein [Actinomadura rudentiformis]